MESQSATCWTVVRGAAEGDLSAREEFGRRYLPVVRAYLASRWGGSRLRSEIDDATQEVFLACFREGGALEKADSTRAGGFRAFLYGVARNVARRFEAKRARLRERGPTELDEIPDRADGASTLFDRAWACSIMQEAADRQRASALPGEGSLRRVEFLKLRFHDGLPVREIARLWGVDPADLHREYPKARAEFRAALVEAMAFHHPGTQVEIEAECARLLSVLA